MTDKDYVKPPKKDVAANKEYVQPPKKDASVNKDYVQPPKKDELFTNSTNNESFYESLNSNEQTLEAQDKGESFLQSIKNHLAPEYREEYNVRRFFGCLMVFLLLFGGSGAILFSLGGLFTLVWTFLAWEFWHYSFWSYNRGFINNFLQNIIYFGSFSSLLGRAILQNFLVLLWVSFIAPISGFLAWRQAVRHHRPLTIDNERTRVWRD
ncbi:MULTISPECIES: hypothetical protein [Aerococcus]|uniref:hypothetical protein n=1 Tax=Aerococcus TaxID=1375 RepID=UPI0018A75F6A|nr:MULTISPECIES: hypothetical protein [Aerococcus]MCY3035872.1 hypothetical protein [Aerococcus sp. Group 2]MCY3038967.1 hypothetical protein [Aerococcus sp. Group 2]MCY3040539.1 hypothetical protein [Aerococcus sp. Group 2]MCY3042536.1 hypothetical protein [Aerococcus sp. Group 2]MDK6519984.1 hypothetical protein [Aerococcus urinae]